MTARSDLIARVREVLLNHAPDAEPTDLDRFAASVCDFAAIYRAGRLATSKRGTEPGLKILARMEEAIFQLADVIGEAKGDELIALRHGPEGLDFNDMFQTLLKWREKLVAAHQMLSADPKPTKKPKNAEARALTGYLARTYERLKGRRATIRNKIHPNVAYGPYLTFLTEMFSVLGVEGSPEYFAKEARKKRAPKNGP